MTHARSGKRWTKHEDDILRRNIPDRRTPAQLVHAMNRSEQAITRRAKELGLISEKQRSASK